jgi:hypothetical protein
MRRGDARSRQTVLCRLIHQNLKETDITKTTPEQNKAHRPRSIRRPCSTSAITPPPSGSGPITTPSTAPIIAPGRAGLLDLIRTLPETLRYENQLIVAEGDYVIAHGRFSGNGRLPPGSPPMSSASKTASSPSTGTSSRTKRRKPNP